jgi:plastocyanin
MRRRLLPLAIVLAAGLVVALFDVPAALAGGYCHTPATDARGRVVVMKDYCYSPTVLRVPVGQTVAFKNTDNVQHPTVGRGADWGFDGVAAASANVRFDKPGIYPYFCHEHLGMIGVVVVGDGNASAAAAAPVQVADPPAAGPAAAAITTEPAAATRRAPWSLVGAALAALGLVGATVVVARRRRPRTGPAPQA